MPVFDLNFVLLAKTLLFGLIATLLLTAAGAPALACVSELLAGARKKVFLDKFARQIAFMGLVTALATLPFSLGAALILGMKGPLFAAILKGQTTLALAGIFALGLSSLWLHWASWARLKDAKAAHRLIGVLGWICAWAELLFLIAFARTLLRYAEAFALDVSLQSFVATLPPLASGSLLWPLAAQAILLSLGAAAGCATLFLLLRRQVEDYGRDYYAYALKIAAQWAWPVTLLQLPVLGFGLASLAGARGQASVYALILAGACYFLAGLTWFAATRSKTPLRQKPTLVLGLVLFVVAVSAQGYCLFSLLDS